MWWRSQSQVIDCVEPYIPWPGTGAGAEEADVINSDSESETVTRLANTHSVLLLLV